jgi:hypothetical protein
MALLELHSLPARRMPERPRGTIALVLVAVVGFVGSFGVWASLASVSSAAIAPALVTVEYSRKAVQHPDGGPVAAARSIFLMPDEVFSGENELSGAVPYRLIDRADFESALNERKVGTTKALVVLPVRAAANVALWLTR